MALEAVGSSPIFHPIRARFLKKDRRGFFVFFLCRKRRAVCVKEDAAPCLADEGVKENNEGCFLPLRRGEFAETACSFRKQTLRPSSLCELGEFARSATAVPTLSHSARRTSVFVVRDIVLRGRRYGGSLLKPHVLALGNKRCAFGNYGFVLPCAGGGTEGQLRPHPLCAGPLGHYICDSLTSKAAPIRLRHRSAETLSDCGSRIVN